MIGDPRLDLVPGHPVWDAYEIDNAIEIPCPTCQSKIHEACINPINHMTRKIACVDRYLQARRQLTHKHAK